MQMYPGYWLESSAFGLLDGRLDLCDSNVLEAKGAGAFELGKSDGPATI